MLPSACVLYDSSGFAGTTREDDIVAEFAFGAQIPLVFEPKYIQSVIPRSSPPKRYPPRTSLAQ